MLEENTPDQQWLFWEWGLRGLDVVSLWIFLCIPHILMWKNIFVIKISLRCIIIASVHDYIAGCGWQCIQEKLIEECAASLRVLPLKKHDIASFQTETCLVRCIN